MRKVSAAYGRSFDIDDWATTLQIFKFEIELGHNGPQYLSGPFLWAFGLGE